MHKLSQPEKFSAMYSSLKSSSKNPTDFFHYDEFPKFAFPSEKISFGLKEAQAQGILSLPSNLLTDVNHKCVNYLNSLSRSPQDTPLDDAWRNSNSLFLNLETSRTMLVNESGWKTRAN